MDKNKLQTVSKRIFLSFALFGVYYGILMNSWGDITERTYVFAILVFCILNLSYDLWWVRKTWLKICLNLILGFFQGTAGILFINNLVNFWYDPEFLVIVVMVVVAFILLTLYENVQNRVRRRQNSSIDVPDARLYLRIQTSARNVLQFCTILILSIVIIGFESIEIIDVFFYIGSPFLLLLSLIASLAANLGVMKLILWYYPIRWRTKNIPQKILIYFILPSCLAVVPFMDSGNNFLIFFLLIFSGIYFFIALNQIKTTDFLSQSVDTSKEEGTFSKIACPGCQMEIEGEILQVLEEKIFVFCKYCGRKLMKFEILRVDESEVIEEHKKILNLIQHNDVAHESI